MNIKLKTFTIKNRMNPNVNTMPALSHASAGNIALGFAIVTL